MRLPARSHLIIIAVLTITVVVARLPTVGNALVVAIGAVGALLALLERNRPKHS
jgi:hypothetical protein